MEKHRYPSLNKARRAVPAEAFLQLDRYNRAPAVVLRILSIRASGAIRDLWVLDSYSRATGHLKSLRHQAVQVGCLGPWEQAPEWFGEVYGGGRGAGTGAPRGTAFRLPALSPGASRRRRPW